MPHFRYQALNADQQTVAGEVEAESVALALSQLEAQGLVVQSIGFATAETRIAQPFARTATPVAPAAAGTEQAALERHLVEVIEKTRPLIPALHAYAAELPQAGSRRQLEAVLRTIERGNSKEAAAGLEKLPTFWIPLRSAATAAKEPSAILARFVQESQRSMELRRQWRWTMAYPVFVLCFALALLIFLSLVPIPIFRNVFNGFGLRLPWFTQFVLGFSAWIASGRIVAFIVGLVLVVYLLVKSFQLLPSSFRNWLSERFGTPLGRSTALAQFSQSLADLLEVETGTPAALRVAGFATRSPRLRRAAWRLAGEMETNHEIDTAAYRRTITATVLHALRSELPQRSRAELLRELSCSYGERAARMLSWTHGIMEPICSVLAGVIVGGVVIALFLPLIGLIHGLSF